MAKLSELFDGIGPQGDADSLFANPTVRKILDGLAGLPGISVSEPKQVVERAPASVEAMPPARDLVSTVEQGAPYTASVPMETASVPARASASQSMAPRERSTIDKVGDFLAGLGQGNGALLPAIGGGIRGMSSGDKAVETENLTVKMLMDKGLDQDTATAVTRNPTILQTVLTSITPERPKSFDLKAGEIRYAPDGKVIARNDDGSKIPPGFQRTDDGRLMPIPGGPADPAYLSDAAKAKGEGMKPPAGFEWVDPNDRSKGLSAIPGGPGEHISAEVAGRLAMMKTSREGIKNARSVFTRTWGLDDVAKSAAASSPLGDVAMLSGDVGIARRDIKIGVEAALRAMTGAAAPETEVQSYMDKFMPNARDTKASAKQKLDALETFMNEAEEIATRGRRVTKPDAAPKVRTYNPATGRLE